MSEGADTSNKTQPFGALIAASSLIVALLYLAGFSFRWAYYFNFGVQHIVFNLSLQSILTASMEMIKLPRNLLITAATLIATLLLVNFLIWTVRGLSSLQKPQAIWRLIARLAGIFGFENQLAGGPSFRAFCERVGH